MLRSLRSGLAINLVFYFLVFATGCSKQPANNQSSDKNTAAANANQKDQGESAPILVRQTLKGDIERISLAISMARDSAKENKWQEVASNLRGARSEVDAALAKKPRLQEEFEALKALLDRTIQLAENGDKEAAAKITELQSRIAAIKTNTF